MKGLAKIILLLTLALSAYSAWADGIKWNTDLSKAMKLAQRSNKPIMIDFYGET